MSKHNDDDPVLVSYSSSRNISFRGEGEELGYTWGEWRQMSFKEQNEAFDEYVYGNLIDIGVDENEEE
jgi:hypothetical protein